MLPPGSSFRLSQLDAFVDRVDADAAQWRRDKALPDDIFSALAATGFFASRWAGGRRAGVRGALSLIERIAPLDGGLALAISLHSEVFLATLSRFSTNLTAASVFADGLVGDAVGVLAITEDQGGSDPAAIVTGASRTDSGGWRISGTKRYISNVENATHGLVLVDATYGRRSGPTVFLVPLTSACVTKAGHYGKLGTDSVGAWRLVFDCEVSDGCRLGPIGAGLAVLLGALRYERMAVSCAMLAGARHALSLSVEFLRQHESQGGRLYELSTLSHRAAEAWVDLQASAALLEQLVDRDEQGVASDADYAAVKFHAATTAQRVTDTALQFLGGRGVDRRPG